MGNFGGELAALGAAICWAIGPVVAFEGVSRLGIFRFSQLRFTVSALLLLILAVLAGQTAIADVRSIVVLSLSGIIGIALGEAALFQATYLLGPRISSILFSTHAPITAFSGAVIFQEQISVTNSLGIILCGAGVSLAILLKSKHERPGGKWYTEEASKPGLYFAGCAVVAQVVGALLTKSVAVKIDPLFGSFIRTVSAGIVFLPFFMSFKEGKGETQFSDLRYVLLSSLVSTVGGMTLLLIALAHADIYRAAVISSLSPVIFLMFMSMFGRQRFSLGIWLATILALIGVLLTIRF
jgi:drug/metabolite transporter (DMT)-like permease